MRLDPFKYFCVLKNDTIKAHCYWTHQLFMFFKSDLLCSLASYCFITLSTKKPEYLERNQALGITVCLSFAHSGLTVSIVCSNEQSRKLSGLSFWLASYNLLCSLSISLSSLKNIPNKHLPSLVSFLEISDRSVWIQEEVVLNIAFL